MQQLYPNRRPATFDWPAAAWAIVPLKSPDTAKSRLADVLSPEQRRTLFFDLAQRALDALRAARGIERVVAATASEEVAGFARKLGAEVFLLRADQGTAAACRDVARGLSPQTGCGLLMIAGDLPLISAEAVERLLHAAGRNSCAVLVPDRRGIGTNAMLCRPPGALAPCFGPNSFAAHLALARAQQTPLRVHHCERLGLDLDVAEDLQFLRSLGAAGAPPALAACAVPAGAAHGDA
ncbi:MAG: hypothetical protein JWR07_3615 [Nevskia sp.]|nr:hypothetical protein [Nevskia sp.]